jgi:DNA-binding response OmpR family regulator
LTRPSFDHAQRVKTFANIKKYQYFGMKRILMILVYNAQTLTKLLPAKQPFPIMIKKTTILVIEGRHAEIPSFAADLQKKGFDVEIAQNGSQAVARLKEVNPNVTVVNAASLRSTGLRICQSLREKDPKLPVILILATENGMEKDTADAVLILPFTVQKLVNRIKPLLPGEGKNVLHVGSIRLDAEHRRVRSLGKSTKLTPRLITLLQILMEHHGEVVEREALFKKVWETNYTGDTRTLDVHISWLRRAIELDPEHPKFLKTIRGVGYRLDV